MPELNISLPPISVYVPDRYYHRPAEPDVYHEAVLISACSIPGQPLLFQVLYRNGVLYERLPLEALQTYKQNEFLPRTQIWDCPSANVTFTRYNTLQDSLVMLDRDKEHFGFLRYGRYIGTFDWYGDDTSEGVGDFGHKAAHLINVLGGSGGFLLRPNDWVRFELPAWTEKLSPDDVIDPPIRNQRKYSCEGFGYTVAEPPSLSAPGHFPKPPAGWVITGYRIPMPGDWILGEDEYSGTPEAHRVVRTDGETRRYILEKDLERGTSFSK